MENKMPKLNKEESKEYLRIWLKSACDRACARASWDDKEHTEESLREFIVDTVYEDMIMALEYNQALFQAKRSENFDKEKLKDIVSYKDLLDKYKKHKEEQKDNGSIETSCSSDMYMSLASDETARADILKSVEDKITNVDGLNPREVIAEVCSDYVKKSQEKQELVDDLEFNLRKATSVLFSRIPEQQSKLYKNLYNQIESKLYEFPTMYIDAFAILEYMRQGGHFADPIESVPVEMKDEPGYEHSQGDGDVHK